MVAATVAKPYAPRALCKFHPLCKGSGNLELFPPKPSDQNQRTPQDCEFLPSVGLQFFSKTQPVCETPSLHFGSGLKLRDGGSLPNPGYQHGEFRTECEHPNHCHKRADRATVPTAGTTICEPIAAYPERREVRCPRCGETTCAQD